jgi:hypothetical protein
MRSTQINHRTEDHRTDTERGFMKKKECLAWALIFALGTEVAAEKCWRKSPPHTHNETQVPEQSSDDVQAANGTLTVQWLQSSLDGPWQLKK